MSEQSAERPEDWVIPERAQAYRERYRREEIGPHYLGWVHFAFTSLGALAAIGFSVMQLHAVLWWEWLTVPLAFLFANYCEYVGHRGPMHKSMPGRRLLYKRHTLQHHRFFIPDAMKCESARDFKIMLFPPVLLVFFLGFLAAPIGLVLFWLTTANVGYLFVATAVGYFLTYEWLHFCYHVDERSLVGRLPFMAALRRHHSFHHDPRLMSRWNFNITFPICDRLFGTYYREPRG